MPRAGSYLAHRLKIKLICANVDRVQFRVLFTQFVRDTWQGGGEDGSRETKHRPTREGRDASQQGMVFASSCVRWLWLNALLKQFVQIRLVSVCTHF